MICEPCKRGEHHKCDNVTTCPCQHRVTKLFEDGTITPLSSRDELLRSKEKSKSALETIFGKGSLHLDFGISEEIK